MLAQIRKTASEFFIFIYFHLYYTEPDTPHGNLFQGGGLFVRKQPEGGGLIESIRYHLGASMTVRLLMFMKHEKGW